MECLKGCKAENIVRYVSCILALRKGKQNGKKERRNYTAQHSKNLGSLPATLGQHSCNVRSLLVRKEGTKGTENEEMNV